MVNDTAEHLRNLGQLVRQERVKRYGAMENASQAGELDQRTWRRIERGHSVRPGSYAGVDRAFGLEAGTTLGATASDEGRAKLARDLVATRTAKSPDTHRGSLDELLGEVRELRREVGRLTEAVRRIADRGGHLENGVQYVDHPLPLISERSGR